MSFVIWHIALLRVTVWSSSTIADLLLGSVYYMQKSIFFCNEWLFELLLLSYQLKAVSSARQFCWQNYCSQDILSFLDHSVNPTDGGKIPLGQQFLKYSTVKESSPDT